LKSVGRADGPPAIPLNLAGDFGGGSLYLALGVVHSKLGRFDPFLSNDALDGSAGLTLVEHDRLSCRR
jgi:hypothetical protein